MATMGKTHDSFSNHFCSRGGGGGNGVPVTGVGGSRRTAYTDQNYHHVVQWARLGSLDLVIVKPAALSDL